MLCCFIVIESSFEHHFSVCGHYIRMCLCHSLPSTQFLGPDSYSYTEFKVHLEERSETRQRLVEESKRKELEIRDMMIALSNDNDALRARVASLEGQLKSKDRLAKENQEMVALLRRKEAEIAQAVCEKEDLRKHFEAKTTELDRMHLRLQSLTKQVKNLYVGVSVCTYVRMCVAVGGWMFTLG